MSVPTFTDSMSVGLRIQLITEGWTPPCPEMRRFAALGMIADIRRQVDASDRVPVKIEVSAMAAEILLAESDALRGSDGGVPVRLSMNPGTMFSVCDLDGHLTESEGMHVAVTFGRLKYAPPAANSNRPRDEELARRAEAVLGMVRDLAAEAADEYPA